MTSDQTFEDLDARLSSDAINLFTRMVETHLAHRADAGDNLFLMPTDFAGEALVHRSEICVHPQCPERSVE